MLAIAVAALGLIGVSWLTIAARVPTVRAPFSFAVALPVLMFGWMGVVTVPLAFTLWCLQFLRGPAAIPKRTLVLFVLLLGAATYWLVGGTSYGVQYQGLRHTVIVLACNAVFVSVLTGLLVFLRLRPSWGGHLAFHWVLFAWVAWCAFPWFGELI